jgi:hypothetical protein
MRGRLMTEELTSTEVKTFTEKLRAWAGALSPREQHFLGEMLARAIDPLHPESYLRLDYSCGALHPLLSYASSLTCEEYACGDA